MDMNKQYLEDNTTIESDNDMTNINDDIPFTHTDSDYKKHSIERMIRKLYENVVKKFLDGDMIIYNASIMRYMTFEKFFNWIILNNTYVSNIMGDVFASNIPDMIELD